jgi:hypothetical protein
MGLLAQRCRICGCSDYDCRQCIEESGVPCSWYEPDLCTNCVRKIPELRIYWINKNWNLVGHALQNDQHWTLNKKIIAKIRADLFYPDDVEDASIWASIKRTYTSIKKRERKKQGVSRKDAGAAPSAQLAKGRHDRIR